MDKLNNINRFKLLTPSKGGSFEADVLQSRLANGNKCKTHLIQERLVLSFLGYRGRYKQGATIREISSNTKLHHSTVAKAITSLEPYAKKVDGKWTIGELPQNWFTPWTEMEHWFDGLPYVMLYLPSCGAKIRYPTTTRRFGINHALVYSSLLNGAKKSKGPIRSFTCAGQAKMLGLNPKTVKSVLADLHYAGFIALFELGRCFDIELKPLSDELLGYFDQKPEATKVEPVAQSPRSEKKTYSFHGDRVDEWRVLCEPLMSQQSAERIIKMAVRLGDSLLDFESRLTEAKSRHHANLKSETVIRGNFGRYVETIFRNRLEQSLERDRDQLHAEVLGRPEVQARIAQAWADSDADPLHDLHTIRPESILDRVKLADGFLANSKAADKILSQVWDLCDQRVQTVTGKKNREATQTLRERVVSTALSKLNHFYKKPELASATSLHVEIDAALSMFGIEPIFTQDLEVEHV